MRLFWRRTPKTQMKRCTFVPVTLKKDAVEGTADPSQQQASNHTHIARRRGCALPLAVPPKRYRRGVFFCDVPDEDADVLSSTLHSVRTRLGRVGRWRVQTSTPVALFRETCFAT